MLTESDLVMVPRELTEEMRRQGFASSSGKEGARALWRAMLGAAPRAALDVPAGEALELLLAFARAAYIALEDGGEELPDGSMQISSDWVPAINATLEALEELPDPPGYVACPIMKARYAITGSVDPAIRAGASGEKL